MDAQIAARLAESERRREAFAACVLALDPEVRALRRGGSLSPAECLPHLAKTEAMYLPMVEPSDSPTKPNGLFRHLVRRSRRGAKMPTFPMLVPTETDPARDAQDWAETRAKLRDALETARPSHVAARHPLFGRLSAEDLLDLFDAHLTYHELRVLADSA